MLKQKREQQETSSCDRSCSSACEPASSAVAGIGLFFVQREKGLCVVDEVVAGGAADSSGRISVGDVLLSVDGRPVDGVCVAMRFLPLVISLTHTHVSGTLPEDVFLANQKE